MKKVMDTIIQLVVGLVFYLIVVIITAIILLLLSSLSRQLDKWDYDGYGDPQYEKWDRGAYP